ncbi:antibiotic biosynthesis monooxygenase family protein [Anatilimnocola floriformis]|uniref:antibiotic biosynthesis monooxygenase family protein n=1 Tax=Anatilimnocola floriformis TaxID=2948575 RepID=UPI0020C51B04|nr:antibiotic biosynthesis monooxygenase [Anatilimnocola floriformis]
MFAATPPPPYYAVIFTSELSPSASGYAELAQRMLKLAAEQPGFLGVESVRDASGVGITVSYWRSLPDIAAWKRHSEHAVAQQLGRSQFYSNYRLRIAFIESESQRIL